MKIITIVNSELEELEFFLLSLVIINTPNNRHFYNCMKRPPEPCAQSKHILTSKIIRNQNLPAISNCY